MIVRWCMGVKDSNDMNQGSQNEQSRSFLDAVIEHAEVGDEVGCEEWVRARVSQRQHARGGTGRRMLT
jgi:hypothetical protein